MEFLTPALMLLVNMIPIGVNYYRLDKREATLHKVELMRELCYFKDECAPLVQYLLEEEQPPEPEDLPPNAETPPK